MSSRDAFDFWRKQAEEKNDKGNRKITRSQNPTATSPTASTSKRKRENDKIDEHNIDSLQEYLTANIKDNASAETALRVINNKKLLSSSLVVQFLKENGIQSSCSNATYRKIASFVGLDHVKQMNDMKTFELSRFRIPTSLFRSILEDMDILLPQYGPLSIHPTEEATSRFFAPIYNRLISKFGFAFINRPEYMIEGRIPTRGRVEYFFKGRTFGRRCSSDCRMRRSLS